MPALKSYLSNNGWKRILAALVIIMAALIFFLVNFSTPRLAVFWLLGLSFGFVLGRSRFCFVSGFGNFYIFRDGTMLKAIIAGMLVATIGFAFIMYNWVPDPSSGMIPPGAHVSPFGWHLVLAGFIFGLGMMLAGCCINGSLYRIGGGLVFALVALTGILLGMGAFLLTDQVWMEHILALPRIWLPGYLGWPGAITLSILLLLSFYLLVHFRQAGIGNTRGALNSNRRLQVTRAGLTVTGLFKRTFIQNWPVMAGGLVLGMLNIVTYWQVDRPWGVTGEIQRWAMIVFGAFGLPVGEISSVPGT